MINFSAAEAAGNMMMIALYAINMEATSSKNASKKPHNKKNFTVVGGFPYGQYLIHLISKYSGEKRGSKCHSKMMGF
jgi:hypothetical protein